MEATRLMIHLKKIFLVFTVGIMIFSFNSLNAQVNFLTSSVVPAARGSVKVKKDKYYNYVIKVDLKNLSEAGRLQPPKNTYVVWMVTEDNITKNIGQIKTTKKFLSKALSANLETKSSFKPVKIYITAEFDPDLQDTDSEIVLTTEYFNLSKD
jgi:hypothetical protein